MSFEYYYKKYKFYYKWLQAVPQLERDGVIGEWLLNNVLMYGRIITEMERNVGRWTGGSTNYKARV